VKARNALVLQRSVAAGLGRKPQPLALPGTIQGQPGFYELATSTQQDEHEFVVGRYAFIGSDAEAAEAAEELVQVMGPWSRGEWAEVKQDQLAQEEIRKAQRKRAKEAEEKMKEVEARTSDRRRTSAMLGLPDFPIEEDMGGDESSAPPPKPCTKRPTKRPAVRAGPGGRTMPVENEVEDQPKIKATRVHGFSVAGSIARAVRKKGSESRKRTQKREVQRRQEMEDRVREEMKQKEEQIRQEVEEQMRADARKKTEEKLLQEEAKRQREALEKDNAATAIQAQYRGAMRRGVTHEKNKTVVLGSKQAGRCIHVLMSDRPDPFARWKQVADVESELRQHPSRPVSAVAAQGQRLLGMMGSVPADDSAQGDSKGDSKGGSTSSRRRVIVETSVVLKQTNDKRISAALIASAGVLAGAYGGAVSAAAAATAPEIVERRDAAGRASAASAGGRASLGLLQIEVKTYDAQENEGGAAQPQPRKMVIGSERLELLLSDWRVRPRVEALLTKVELLLHCWADSGGSDDAKPTDGDGGDDDAVDSENEQDAPQPPMSFAEALSTVLLHEKEAATKELSISAVAKAVIKLQSLFRKIQARRGMLQAFREKGLLLAMPGTIQNKSGWYEMEVEGVAKVICFEVDDHEGWITTMGPLPKAEFRALTASKKEEAAHAASTEKPVPHDADDRNVGTEKTLPQTPTALLETSPRPLLDELLEAVLADVLLREKEGPTLLGKPKPIDEIAAETANFADTEPPLILGLLTEEVPLGPPCRFPTLLSVNGKSAFASVAGSGDESQHPYGTMVANAAAVLQHVRMQLVDQVQSDGGSEVKAPVLLTMHMLRNGTRKQTAGTDGAVARGSGGRQHENALIVHAAHYSSTEAMHQTPATSVEPLTPFCPNAADGTVVVQSNLTRLSTVALRQAGLLVPPLFEALLGVGMKLSTQQLLQARATEATLWQDTMRELVDRSCLKSDEAGNVFLLPNESPQQQKLQQQLKEVQDKHVEDLARLKQEMKQEMLDAKQEQLEARSQLADAQEKHKEMEKQQAEQAQTGGGEIQVSKEIEEMKQLKQALQHAEERARLSEKQLKAKQQLERIKKEKEANSDLLQRFKRAKEGQAAAGSGNGMQDEQVKQALLEAKAHEKELQGALAKMEERAVLAERRDKAREAVRRTTKQAAEHAVLLQNLKQQHDDSMTADGTSPPQATTAVVHGQRLLGLMGSVAAEESGPGMEEMKIALGNAELKQEELKELLAQSEERAKLAEEKMNSRAQLEKIKFERKANSDVLERFHQANEGSGAEQGQRLLGLMGGAAVAEDEKVGSGSVDSSELQEALRQAELKQQEAQEMLKKNQELEQALKLAEERAALAEKHAKERQAKEQEAAAAAAAAVPVPVEVHEVHIAEQVEQAGSVYTFCVETGGGDRSSALPEVLGGDEGQSELAKMQERLRQAEARASKAEKRATAEANLRRIKLQPKSERLLAFERFKERQRNLKVSMLALVKMQGMVRRLNARRLVVAMAAEKGTLLAMPGSIQGESGWYEGESGHVSEFEVTKRGEWLCVGEAMEGHAWAAMMRKKRRDELQRTKAEERRKGGLLSDFERMKARQRALLEDGKDKKADPKLTRKRSADGKGPNSMYYLPTLIWKDTEEARVLMKSLIKIQAIIRRQRARREAVALAQKRGMMLALPGTIQGESGWYESGATGDGKGGESAAMIVQYKVSEEGDWEVVGKPVGRKEWMANRESQAKGEEKMRQQQQQQRKTVSAADLGAQQKEAIKQGGTGRRRSSTGLGPSQQEAARAAVMMDEAGKSDKFEVQVGMGSGESATQPALGPTSPSSITDPLTGASLELTGAASAVELARVREEAYQQGKRETEERFRREAAFMPKGAIVGPPTAVLDAPVPAKVGGRDEPRVAAAMRKLEGEKAKMQAEKAASEAELQATKKTAAAQMLMLQKQADQLLREKDEDQKQLLAQLQLMQETQKQMKRQQLEEEERRAKKTRENQKADREAMKKAQAAEMAATRGRSGDDGNPTTLETMEAKVVKLERQLADRNNRNTARESQLRRTLQETRALMATERTAAALRMRRREDEHHESARASEARISEYQTQMDGLMSSSESTTAYAAQAITRNMLGEQGTMAANAILDRAEERWMASGKLDHLRLMANAELRGQYEQSLQELYQRFDAECGAQQKELSWLKEQLVGQAAEVDSWSQRLRGAPAIGFGAAGAGGYGNNANEEGQAATEMIGSDLVAQMRGLLEVSESQERTGLTAELKILQEKLSAAEEDARELRMLRAFIGDQATAQKGVAAQAKLRQEALARHNQALQSSGDALHSANRNFMMSRPYSGAGSAGSAGGRSIAVNEERFVLHLGGPAMDLANFPAGSAERERLVQAVTLDVSKAARVATDRLTVDALTAGSVVVSMRIHASPLGVSWPPEVEIKQRLLQLVEDPKSEIYRGAITSHLDREKTLQAQVELAQKAPAPAVGMSLDDYRFNRDPTATYARPPPGAFGGLGPDGRLGTADSMGFQSRPGTVDGFGMRPGSTSSRPSTVGSRPGTSGSVADSMHFDHMRRQQQQQQQQQQPSSGSGTPSGASDAAALTALDILHRQQLRAPRVRTRVRPRPSTTASAAGATGGTTGVYGFQVGQVQHEQPPTLGPSSRAYPGVGDVGLLPLPKAEVPAPMRPSRPSGAKPNTKPPPRARTAPAANGNDADDSGTGGVGSATIGAPSGAPPSSGAGTGTDDFGAVLPPLGWGGGDKNGAESGNESAAGAGMLPAFGAAADETGDNTHLGFAAYSAGAHTAALLEEELLDETGQHASGTPGKTDPNHDSAAGQLHEHAATPHGGHWEIQLHDATLVFRRGERDGSYPVYRRGVPGEGGRIRMAVEIWTGARGYTLKARSAVYQLRQAVEVSAAQVMVLVRDSPDQAIQRGVLNALNRRKRAGDDRTEASAAGGTPSVEELPHRLVAQLLLNCLCVVITVNGSGDDASVARVQLAVRYETMEGDSIEAMPMGSPQRPGGASALGAAPFTVNHATSPSNSFGASLRRATGQNTGTTPGPGRKGSKTGLVDAESGEGGIIFRCGMKLGGQFCLVTAQPIASQQRHESDAGLEFSAMLHTGAKLRCAVGETFLREHLSSWREAQVAGYAYSSANFIADSSAEVKHEACWQLSQLLYLDPGGQQLLIHSPSDPEAAAAAAASAALSPRSIPDPPAGPPPNLARGLATSSPATNQQTAATVAAPSPGLAQGRRLLGLMGGAVAPAAQPEQEAAPPASAVALAPGSVEERRQKQMQKLEELKKNAVKSPALRRHTEAKKAIDDKQVLGTTLAAAALVAPVSATPAVSEDSTFGIEEGTAGDQSSAPPVDAAKAAPPADEVDFAVEASAAGDQSRSPPAEVAAAGPEEVTADVVTQSSARQRAAQRRAWQMEAVKQAEAEERAKKEAEERAKKEAEERAKKEAEERAKKEAEERAKTEVEERVKKEAEKEAKLMAEKETKLMAEKEAMIEAKRNAEWEDAKREVEEQEDKAVTVIQSSVRQRVAQRRAWQMQDEKQAATVLQSKERQRQAVEKVEVLKEQTAAATMIQSKQRQKQAVLKVREEKDHALGIWLVTRMQSAMRRVHARRKVVARALETNSLLAMPGTIQGQSGWYEGESEKVHGDTSHSLGPFTAAHSLRSP
jgi:hypothetical protein